ncbi:MAG: hypothetical protein KF868_04195 [Acidobacteria bacterium]|nr:hypothetical protein [Acidobacteriota bacterium]MCW5967647.1 hypothetical protein [Blastocatellales bacterium]
MMRRLIVQFPLSLILICAFAAVTSGQSGDARLPAVVKPKPKPKPTPPPTSVKREEPTPPPSSRPPATVPALAFNRLITAALDTQKSGIITTGIYYDDYLLTATSADVFTIMLQSADQRVNVQVYTKAGEGLPTLKNPQSSEFKLDTPGATLPEDGEYRIRVYGVIADQGDVPVGYTLRINRTGLTEDGYRDRLEAITGAFKPGENTDETISRLEQLVNDDDNQPGAHELLSVMYLYHRKDAKKAETAMDKAIKLKGAAIFSVTYDPQLGRKLVKKPDGSYDWTESRTGWLRIQQELVTLVDATNEQLFIFNLSGSQIREVGPLRNSQMPILQIRPVAQQRFPYAVSPGTKTQAEIDLILKFIRQYAPPRG